MKHLGGDGSPLHLPMDSLGLSDVFIKTSLAHGYTCLSDFQQMSMNELLALDWFTPAMFRELAEILKTMHKLVSSSY